MPNNWYLTPSTGDGSTDNAYRPDYVDSINGLTGYSGQRLPGNSPEWCVRVYGTSQALMTLAGEPGVAQPSDSIIASHLNRATGQTRSKAEWDMRFSDG